MTDHATPQHTSAPSPAPPPPRLAALKHRDFRLMWLGQVVSITGSQMQLAAIGWHVYQVLRGADVMVRVLGRDVPLHAEALGLGGLGLANVIPIVLFALVGGMIADSHDRRTVMLCTQSALAVFAAGLAVFTLTGRADVWVIYLFSAATAAASAFNNPAQQSLIPHLVPREHLANAVSLNTLNWQIGTIVGPALAGILVGAFGAQAGGTVGATGAADAEAGSTFGLGVVYAVNAVSFLAVILALAAMRHRGGRPALAAGIGWRPLVEGLRFVRGQRLIWSTMLLDFYATFFSSARTMLPIVAGEILGVGVQGYGILSAAAPIGAVAAGTLLALRRTMDREGLVLLVSVVVYGVATAGFGLATGFWVAFVFYALTGAADTVSTVIRATLRQTLTPDHLRGRMVGFNMMFFMGGPQLGELEAGLVAALFGAPFAIASGGVATVALTLWLAWRNPGLRGYASGCGAGGGSG